MKEFNSPTNKQKRYKILTILIILSLLMTLMLELNYNIFRNSFLIVYALQFFSLAVIYFISSVIKSFAVKLNDREIVFKLKSKKNKIPYSSIKNVNLIEKPYFGVNFIEMELKSPIEFDRSFLLFGKIAGTFSLFSRNSRITIIIEIEKAKEFYLMLSEKLNLKD